MPSSGSPRSTSPRGSSSSPRETDGASARREAHREELRKQRQAELRRQKMFRNGIIIAAIVLVVVIIGGIVLAVNLTRKATEEAGPLVAPEGIATDTTYYTLGAPEGSGKPVVELYLDFMCPACGQFHQINGADIDDLVKNQEVTLHLHTRTFLDPNSTTGDYSTRAANAAACVADEDPALFMPMHDLLFENQPDEGTAGLTNAKLTELAKEAGASDAVSSCISGKKFEPWLNDVVEKQAAADTQGTPTVLIDGQDFQGWNTPGALAQAVRASAPAASDG